MIQDLLKLEPTKLNINLTNYNFLIYAEPGIGKTTFATQLFPEKSLILGAELGYKGIPNVYGVPIPDYLTLRKYVDQLDTVEARDRFDTLIIDTTTKIGEIIEQYVLSIYGKETLGDCKAHGGAYPLINRYYNKLFDRLKARGYNFIYICHSVESEIKGDMGQVVGVKNVPKMSDRLNSLISPEVDFIFYLTFNGDRQRIVVTDQTQYNVGKQRIKLPTVMPLDAKMVKEEFEKSIDSISNGDYNNSIIKNTVMGHKTPERNYTEILAEIEFLYQSIVGVGLEGSAIELVNGILGKDDSGIQRTLSNMNQSNAESLEVIVIELRKILEGDSKCQNPNNLEEPR